MNESELKELYEVINTASKESIPGSHDIDFANLRGKDIRETLINVHSFVRKCINFHLDSHEVINIKSPSRTYSEILREGKPVDNTLPTIIVFASSILRKLYIEHEYIFAKYHNRNFFQHCYLKIPVNGGPTFFILDFLKPDPFDWHEQGLTGAKSFNAL